PDVKLSVRGYGTNLRTDPVVIGLQKTRLFDPTLNMMGTNDHPGDYRASGCTACHVVYANDRSPVHSAFWAEFGNRGQSFSMYPSKQVNPTSEQEFAANEHNPEAAAARGLWSDLYPDLKNHRGEVAGPNFLENLAPRLNPKLQHNQFADFHGHGWVFSAVFKQ